MVAVRVAVAAALLCRAARAGRRDAHAGNDALWKGRHTHTHAHTKHTSRQSLRPLHSGSGCGQVEFESLSIWRYRAGGTHIGFQARRGSKVHLLLLVLDPAGGRLNR